MKIRILFILVGLLQVTFSVAQTDSIVSFSGLKFHSEYEKEAYTNFVQNNIDTLDAFLAVDELLSKEEASYVKKKIEDLCNELVAKKIDKKKVNAQIKLIYATVKKNYLTKVSHH